ncbi:ATP-binding protein [Limnohabitans sp.]|uniref:ATP-binding protein n=1 Tax=Limnohabitans sp. TaxID=1907725 RepID=UPI00333EFB22
MPYLFFVIWLLIVAMVILALITPYPNGVPVPLFFAGVLLVLQVLFILGLPFSVAVNIGLLAALLQVCYAASMSGGIFSPRMAWMVAIPMIPFYAVSRKSGLVWFVLVMLTDLAMAYVTWQGWLPHNPNMGAAQVMSAYASYTVVTLIVFTVPFLFDNLFRQAYKASAQRNLELDENRKELLRTLALREQFIATVSHELRTPMNAILGFNNLLLARSTDNPQALKILNHTRQSADHLLTVINDVLDYSQLQAGKIKVQSETFALRDTVHTAFDLFAQRVESMHLNYTCTIDDTVPQWVYADRHRLMQVLVNLLGNAIKFTHQGHVTLHVRQQPLCVHFSVRDSGIGISQAQQPKIFQRFVQADDDIQSRYGGNGLGLSITQRLVEIMGGHVGFESKLGVGSIFWFTLPLVEVAPPPADVSHSVQRSTPVEAVQRFLVVDDHPINRLLVRQILKNHWKNCELVEAENGLKALEALRQQDFDVILMDMVMPEMDGIEATTSLRLTFDQPTRDTPVLGLTANVNPLDLERFAAAGVNSVVLKPFDANKLCVQVDEMLREKKSSLGS